MSKDGGGEFRTFAALWRDPVEAALERLLPSAGMQPAVLHAAMRHSMFPGGKRLRPILALIGCRATGGDLERAVRPAAAIECLHTYSLVHDDLPCMDDDELRRGRPTAHVVYGEAVAVLAGDALLTLAFEGVAEAGPIAVRELAEAAGSLGMVGGQVADLQAEGSGEAALAADRVQWIHDHKTAALIAASLVVGALAGQPSGRSIPEGVLDLLRRYGTLAGRAFQIADDCLDLTGAAEDLGKQPGQDLAADKLTYPAVLGLEASRQEAQRLAGEAAALAPEIVTAGRGRPLATAGSDPELDGAIRLLQDVAFYSVTRTR